MKSFSSMCERICIVIFVVILVYRAKKTSCWLERLFNDFHCNILTYFRVTIQFTRKYLKKCGTKSRRDLCNEQNVSRLQHETISLYTYTYMYIICIYVLVCFMLLYLCVSMFIECFLTTMTMYWCLVVLVKVLVYMDICLTDCLSDFYLYGCRCCILLLVLCF